MIKYNCLAMFFAWSQPSCTSPQTSAENDRCLALGLGQTGLCWVYVWWSGFGIARGGGDWNWIPAVGVCPLLFSFTRSDKQFPPSEPKATLVSPASVPHIILTSYPCPVWYFGAHTWPYFDHSHFSFDFIFCIWSNLVHSIFFKF